MHHLLRLVEVAIIVLLQSVSTKAGLGKEPAMSLRCTAVKPTPSGCGIAGKLRYNSEPSFAVGSPQVVESVEECASFCARRIANAQNYPHGGFLYPSTYYAAYCTSFEFNSVTLECQLGRLNVSNNVRPVQSNSVFFNNDCFNCGSFCNQPFGAQLLDNGGFEDELLGPWATSGANIGKGHGSARAFHCTASRSNGCFLTQAINMCRQETYVIEFDYLAITAPGSSGTSFRAVFGGPPYLDSRGGGNIYFLSTPTNTDRKAWKTLRAYFTYLSGTHIGPYFDFMDTEVSIDNVYVARVPNNPSPIPGAKSIIKNGGFETNDYAPWTTEDYSGFDGMFSIVTPGIASQYGLFFKASSFETFASPYLVQTVKTKPNTTYLVTYNVQVVRQAFALSLYIGPDDERLTYDRTFGPGNHTFSALVFTPTNATRVRLLFADVQAETHGSILVDNVAMVEIEKSKFFP